MLAEGEGVEQNIEEGLAYLELAANLNQRSACEYLDQFGDTLSSNADQNAVRDRAEKWASSYDLPARVISPVCERNL